MKLIDGQKTLTKTMLKKLFSSKDNEILILYYNNQEDKLFDMLLKEDFYQYVFVNKSLNTIFTYDAVIIFATNDIVIETNLKNIEHWYNLTRALEELLLTLNILKKSNLKDKFIAVGQLIENDVANVETLNVNNIKDKLILNWLNEKITDYILQRKFDNLRICLNFNYTNINDWHTLDELKMLGLVEL